VTSDPDFKVTTFCEVEYQKNKVKDKVTIAQEESTTNMWNGTLRLVTLTDL